MLAAFVLLAFFSEIAWIVLGLFVMVKYPAVMSFVQYLILSGIILGTGTVLAIIVGAFTRKERREEKEE
ncbi:MAG: hypothetical protein M0Q94_15110 [Candidatus Cloacimonetes bacterium]|nr:hypothetical protein [Candidatus Cloacimonadota bacterium]